ncbi:MAG TPA: xylulokinase [Polyangia bacterium]|nr:xylulokinase [Polyangia bacterium]
MAFFLGVDVGTSNVKALVVDGRGRAVARASEPLALRTPQPGWAEQDPAAWWKAATRAIRRAVGQGRGARKIDAVGLSGQMHSSVFLDRANRVIRPALLWCDGRTTAECREITERVGEQSLRDWVSNPALEGFTLPKILWLRNHEPAAFERLAKVLLPKDYLRLQLTGGLATELSDASGTLLLDVANRRWSREMLDAMALSPDLLPEVGGSTDVLGRISPAAARATGLTAGTPVVGGGADNACGAVGVGAVAPGAVVASWGTSGTVLCPTDAPKVDPQMRAHTFCHAAPDTWYVMGVMLTAGGAFAWYRQQLAPELARKKDADVLLNREAAKVPIGALDLTFLPYLQGERTPHRDAAARAAFVGLSLAHTRAHLTRAVLEGICFGLRDSLEIIAALGMNVSDVMITGGGANAPFVRQLQADVYGKPVVPVDQPEGPALGAALLAAVGVGGFRDLSTAAATIKRRPPVAPRAAAHAAYAAPYRRFARLYPALRDARRA